MIPAVILAGGKGARFDHESEVLPKPLIEVAGKPILRHIIDLYAQQGVREFVILAGHLGWKIVEYFLTVDGLTEAAGVPTYMSTKIFSWFPGRLPGSPLDDLLIRVVDTGQEANTSERLKRALSLGLVRDDFFLTYGDGLGDVDLAALYKQHKERGAEVTITTVRPPGRFGVVEYGNAITPTIWSIEEKPAVGWINGGFMVVKATGIDQYLSPHVSIEEHTLPTLAKHGRLDGYRHSGFWKCMDTRRDREMIEADVKANGGRLPWLTKSS